MIVYFAADHLRTFIHFAQYVIRCRGANSNQSVLNQIPLDVLYRRLF